MLLVSSPITTPHGLSVANTVWRWVGLQIDAAASQAVVVLCAYPSLEIAALAGTPEGKLPLAEERYTITGMEFGELAMSPPVGVTASDVISNMIYSHLRGVVPKFAGSTDVGV